MLSEGDSSVADDEQVSSTVRRDTVSSHDENPERSANVLERYDAYGDIEEYLRQIQR